MLGYVLQHQRHHSTVVTAHIGCQTSVQLTLYLIILTQPFHLAINFGSLFHASSTHRMPETHQPSTWIDWDIALNRGTAREHQVNAFPLFGPTDCLIHHEFGNREAVVHFGHLHILRCKAPILQCLRRRCRGRIEPEEIFDLPQGVATETIRTHLDTLGEWPSKLLYAVFTSQDDRGSAVAYLGAIAHLEMRLELRVLQEVRIGI